MKSINGKLHKSVKKAVNLGLAAILSISLGVANVKGETNNPEAKKHYERGREEFGEGRRTSALQETEEAIRLDPKYFEAYVSLSDIYINYGEYDKSIENAKKAISLNPKDGDGYLMLGIAYWRMDVFELTTSHCKEAEKYASKAAELYRKQHKDIDAKRAEFIVNSVRKIAEQGWDWKK
jgi:tetratricopeptide (TPR) repeat protein